MDKEEQLRQTPLTAQPEEQGPWWSMEGKFELNPESRRDKEKGFKEERNMRKRLCVLSPWSLKSILYLQGAAQYLYSLGNASKQGTVSRCIERLIWSPPKLKVWWRASAAWSGNTLWVGELGSSAGRRDIGWKSSIHRGRKWDFDTEKYSWNSKILSAYE